MNGEHETEMLEVAQQYAKETLKTLDAQVKKNNMNSESNDVVHKDGSLFIVHCFECVFCFRFQKFLQIIRFPFYVYIN
jgi:hypothetical protein